MRFVALLSIIQKFLTAFLLLICLIDLSDRICGNIYCSHCSNYVVSERRVCAACYKAVQYRLQQIKLHKLHSPANKISFNTPFHQLHSMYAEQNSESKANPTQIPNSDYAKGQIHDNNTDSARTTNSEKSNTSSNSAEGSKSLLEDPLLALVNRWSADSITLNSNKPSSQLTTAGLDLNNRISNWNLSALNEKISLLEKRSSSNHSIYILIGLSLVLALILTSAILSTLFYLNNSTTVLSLAQVQKLNFLPNLYGLNLSRPLYFLLSAVFTHKLQSFAASLLLSCVVLYIFGWKLFPRAVRVYFLAGVIIGSYKLLEKQAKWFNWSEELSERRWDEAHEKLSLITYKHTVELQGFWIKLGQYMASRGDIMPPQWVVIIEQLYTFCHFICLSIVINFPLSSTLYLESL
jgi:hypothetical protein